MTSCPVCGGVNFEKHAGYLYCLECQTQSQDYREEEYEYRAHDSAVKDKKRTRSQSSKSKHEDETGTWTTWEAFNYIIYGMTQELKPIVKKKHFETIVLKLWACYLNRAEAGFLSRVQEDVFPKLGLKFKQRDAKILYNYDTQSLISKSSKSKKKIRKRKKAGSVSNMSVASVSSVESKRSRNRKKMKVMTEAYNESVSKMSQDTTLADATLESLGQSSDNESTFNISDTSSRVSAKEKREVFTEKAYEHYKKKKSELKKDYDYSRDPTVINKSRILAIIHLALTFTRSNVHLADLLRFIREGHLSYAKVTHFFPREIKLLKGKEYDILACDKEISMPTHHYQRAHYIQLARHLGIDQFSHPDVEALVTRYCKELKLPDQVAIYSIRVIRLYLGNYKRKILVYTKGNKSHNYEGMAMASIIFVIKFYFGLDDKIEIALSRYARAVNSLKDGTNKLFVFEDWQKYLECRKTILKDFHYPTQERFDSDHYDAQKFINILFKESKDEYIAERFLGTKKQEMREGLQDILSKLADADPPAFLEFPPSLTPQTTYLKIIKDRALKNELDFSTAAGNSEEYEKKDLPWGILNMKFKECDISFTRNPGESIQLLEENNFKVVELSKSDFLNDRNLDVNQFYMDNQILFVMIDGSYWTGDISYIWKNVNYDAFNVIFSKFPKNFQWILTEGARIVENRVRELYFELIRIERRLLSSHRPDFNCLKKFDVKLKPKPKPRKINEKDRVIRGRPAKNSNYIPIKRRRGKARERVLERFANPKKLMIRINPKREVKNEKPDEENAEGESGNEVEEEPFASDPEWDAKTDDI